MGGLDDDGPVGAWRLDGGTLGRLRLEHLRSAAKAGRWGDVELEAEELLDEDPGHVEALFLLAEASVALGRYEVARAAYAAVAARDPDGHAVSSAHVLAGQALASFHVCRVQEAIELAREVIRLDPEQAEAHHVLSMALDFVPGRSGEALAERMAAARLDPDAFPLPDTRRFPTWEVVITRALEQVEPSVRAFYAQVPFRIEELPDLARLRGHAPPTSPAVLALTDGEPPPLDEDPGLPEGVAVYARNLGRAGSVEAMIRALADDLVDEAQAWLPPEEDDEPDDEGDEEG